MEHAGPAALAALDALFVAMRKRAGVADKRAGHFYRKGRALAHFHQDLSGLYADLHDGPEWRRLRVSTQAERRRFLAALDKVLRGD